MSDTKVLQVLITKPGMSISKKRLQKDFESSIDKGESDFGLVLLKKLLSLMDGTVRLDLLSCSTDSVFLTMPSLATPTSLSKSKPIPIKTNSSVLVVEDNPILQRMLQKMVSSCGLSVTVASDGLQAVELCQKDGFSMVLMDLQLPFLSGIEAAKRIRAHDSEIPIIALTAGHVAGDQEQCMKVGMNGFIPKPLTMHTLKKLFSDYLGLHPETLPD
jgi:CheY-like chemotaxis protein